MFPTVSDTSKGVSVITVPALTHSALHKHKGQDQAEASSLTYHVQERVQTPQGHFRAYCVSQHP